MLIIIYFNPNAHERIRFEQLKKQYQNRKVVSISPLFPVVLELTASEQVLPEGEKSELPGEMGFEIRPLSGNAYDVKRFPREMVDLVLDLFEASNPDFCPHQRPIMIRLGLDEIEKK